MNNVTGKLVVIGGGPGGYSAAFYAADLGFEVTLIDIEPELGGVCLHKGCIPSKTLLHAAKIIYEVEDLAEYGISFSEKKLDIDKLRNKKEQVVNSLTKGLKQLANSKKITLIQGTAVFNDTKKLTVTTATGEALTVEFDWAIIASGSLPVRIPGMIDSPLVMDSTDALALTDIPEKLLVIGGGYIGVELGQVYAALDAKVSVVEMSPTLLPGADRDLAEVLGKQLTGRFDTIMTEAKVVGMTEMNGAVNIEIDRNREKTTHTYDRVLVAVGRKPSTTALGLDVTGVECSSQGYINVDAQCRTNVPNIFAIGDCIGQPMLAHKAEYEAVVAVEAIAGKKTIVDYKAIPAVIFTDPEIAWCGLTEAEAAERNINVNIIRFPWAASGRAATENCSDGLTKLLIDPTNEMVLGVGIAGRGAGELIAEAVLAIEMGATREDLSLTIHPHPTLSETIKLAAMIFEKATKK